MRGSIAIISSRGLQPSLPVFTCLFLFAVGPLTLCAKGMANIRHFLRESPSNPAVRNREQITKNRKDIALQQGAYSVETPCFLSHIGDCRGRICAAHFDPWGDKGAATKVSDSACLPLCDGLGVHHDEQHCLGWPAFQKKYGFDGRSVVTGYWLEWLKHTPMGRAWAAGRDITDHHIAAVRVRDAPHSVD